MRPPINQLNTGRKSGSLLSIKIAVTAVQKAPVAAPASMRTEIEVDPDLTDMKYDMATAQMPPINPATGTALIPPTLVGMPTVKIMVAPSPAPEATPIKQGSASTFLNIPWYVAPETANDDPTSTANITLGNLICHNMISDDSDHSEVRVKNGVLEIAIKSTVQGSIETDPIDDPRMQQIKVINRLIIILIQGGEYR